MQIVLIWIQSDPPPVASNGKGAPEHFPREMPARVSEASLATGFQVLFIHKALGARLCSERPCPEGAQIGTAEQATGKV